MLTVTRRSAVKARTQAANQLHALVVGAPEPIKDQLKGMKTQSPRPSVCPLFDPAESVLCQLREAGPPPPSPPLPGSRHRDRRARCRDQTPLRQGQPGPVGRQWCRPPHSRRAAGRSRRQPPTHEIGTVLRCALCPQPRPGIIRASGPAPAQPGAPTGKPTAPYGRCTTNRIRTDAATKNYVTRREAEGKKRTEIIPLPKRHITREIYRLITTPPPTPNYPELRNRPPASGNHRHPGRTSHRNPPQPHLSTRRRPGPQPPPRHPVPELAPKPPARPITDLTNLGAS